MAQKMTILLTGCAGYIGAETARQLLDTGHTVVGVDNLNDYYDVRLKKMRLESLLGKKGFHFLQGDIEDKAFVDQAFSSFPVDKVINLAARAGVPYSMKFPEIYMTTNLMGSLNILQAMNKFGVKKFVLASTSSLYAGQSMPFNEDLPVNTPISPYAASKKAAEVLSYTYHFLYGIDVTIVRYFTVYGPYGRPDMSIFRFIKWIDEGTPITLYGDGSQSRDFTYVEDIARGTILGLKDVGYQIINLGGGNNPIALDTVIHKMEQLLGKKASIENHDFHKTDLRATWANIAKAKALLNWAPEITFDQGLARTVDWYIKNKSEISKIVI